MKKLLIALLYLVFSVLSSMAQPAISGIIVPKFMADTTKTTGQGPRIPVVFRAKLTGLTSNTTYRYETKAICLSYINGMTPDFDGPTSTGAANPIYMHQNGNFTMASNPSFSNLGGYDSLLTNASGEYEGWFAFEPTGNVRFNSGNFIHPRVIINNGVVGNSTNLTYLTLVDSILTLSIGTASNQASGVYSRSLAKNKNIAVLWDNINATGRPISCAIIENDGLSIKSAPTPTNYPLFYRDQVDSFSGAWGTLMPNSNSNGIRRVDNRNLSDGSLVYFNSDADGIWPTGNKNTINPSVGFNAIKIDSNDVPLQPGPLFTFEKSSYYVNENGGTVTIAIKNKYPIFATANITASLKIGGSATIADFNFASSTITFTTTDTINYFSIPINNDLFIEGDEVFYLHLSNLGIGGSIGVDSITAITIIDDDFPLPEVIIQPTKKMVSEWVTSSTFDVVLSAKARVPASVTINAISGSASTNDYTFNSMILNFNVGDSIKSVPFGIVDDAIQESLELFYLQISNPIGAVLGINTDTITIIDNDFPRYTISQINTINANTGIADSIGKKYDLTGLVYGINYRPSGLQFVMRDNTAGITIFKAIGNLGYNVKEGDSIRVIGTVTQFNGLTEFNADTLLYYSNNKKIKIPTIVTKLDEAAENDLIRINSVQFDSPIATWPTVASIISVHTATDTFIIRLQLANSDILGTSTPQGAFDVVGLGSQFDNTNPYTSGYQLVPRFLSDIIPVAPPAIVTVDTSLITIAESGGQVKIKFKISNVNGNSTTVNLINSGTANASTDYNSPPMAVTFPPSAANGDSIILSYTIIDDTEVESSETINVSILPSFNAIVVGKSKTIIINDNDIAPVKFTIDSLPFSVNENVGIVRVKVKISNVNGLASSGMVTFSGTAVFGIDYLAAPATFLFPANAANGDSVFVTYGIIDDGLYEPTPETIKSSFSTVNNAIMNGGKEQIITIVDNDINGIKQASAFSELYVYPNPSSGSISILFANRFYKITIINSIGQKINQLETNEKVQTIDGLNAGVYFVNVCGDGFSITKRIVVL